MAGKHGDALKIRVAAPPVGDAANTELIRFLAERLGTARSAIAIAVGRTGRRKTVSVSGMDTETARRILEEQ